MKPRLHELTRSQYVVHALDWIFERPIFKSSDFVTSAGIPEPTARRLLGVLQREGVLRALTPARGRRPAVLAFPDLLNLAEGPEPSRSSTSSKLSCRSLSALNDRQMVLAIERERQRWIAGSDCWLRG